jgi:hypothetical protein
MSLMCVVEIRGAEGRGWLHAWPASAHFGWPGLADTAQDMFTGHFG